MADKLDNLLAGRSAPFQDQEVVHWRQRFTWERFMDDFCLAVNRAA